MSIGSNCLQLLCSYLTNRRQAVKIEDAKSSELIVKSGVPQGSLLGPLFFLVYINDLPDSIMSPNFGYTDDFKIIGENNVSLNIDIRKVHKWCSENFMSMNMKKCKSVSFKGTTEITIGSYRIEKAENMKDLGIIVSENLTWSTHVRKRAQIALTALFTLKRNLAITTSFKRKSAYFSYVVPIVSYGSSLWLPSKGDLRIVEKSIQRKAMK